MTQFWPLTIDSKASGKELCPGRRHIVDDGLIVGREYLEQATGKELHPNAAPARSVAAAAAHRPRRATKSVSVNAQAIAPGHRVDLPGGPVPVTTHRHTSGHTAFHLPQHGSIVTGDALVTEHPLSKIRGPQLLPPVFDHGHGDTIEALDDLALLEADASLPVHGPVVSMPITAGRRASA
ncbi:MBL fold metallo-hydrolase [Prescottella equi]|uniref:MBL fold metallo-hydrolase n=1 Tax=Rhodococcus hoagii TaxID=43767 RepID=UPI001F33AB2C|nr:MBL fold metallo-hydrolase [Prescottella equi]